MRNRGVIHRGDARIGIYFRRQLVGSDRPDSGRSGLGQTRVLDAGSAPQARRSHALALLRLALARGPGGLSLRDAAAWAHMAQVAELTDASLNDRLHQSCEFLAAVAAAMLQAKTPGCCFRWPGRVLRISDGSCVSKPGSKGTDWRVHAVYDLGAGG